MKKIKFFGIMVLVLIIIRLLVPLVALVILNSILDKKMGIYYGHVQDLNLSLYRGAYQLQGLEIKKHDTKNPSLFFVKEIDLSIAWRGLLKKNITADVTISEANVKITDSEDSKKSTKHWSDFFNTIVPISIETLKVNNSVLSFTKNDLKAPLAIVVEKIELQASNLRSRSEGEMSPFHLNAEIQKHARLDVNGVLNILKNPPEGEMDIKIEKLNMASINKILRLYIPIDFTKGELSVYAEAVYSGGNVHGYAKLFLNDTDIIAPKQKYLGAKHLIIEISTAIGNWFLKNPKTKKIAVRLPFNYKNGKFDVNLTAAFWSAVHNSNESLKPGIENSVSLKK